MNFPRLLTIVSCCLATFGIASNSKGQTQISPPKAGLVGWWQGNGNADDSSGNGFNGVLEGGMGFTSGISGLAFAAGSGGKRVYVPDNPAFYLTSLTMAAWVDPTAFGYEILFRGDSRPGLDPYLIGLNASSRFGIQITSASDAIAALWAPQPLPYNVWTHVEATLDGATGDMRVYLNGLLVAETNTAVRPFGALDPTLTPGLGIGNEQTADFPFQGAIEQVLLYSRALSSSEIQQLAQSACSPHTAKATATVVNGFVVGATITDSGCGYTNTPAVVIQGGGGKGATATAVVSNGLFNHGYRRRHRLHERADCLYLFTVWAPNRPGQSGKAVLFGSSYWHKLSASGLGGHANLDQHRFSL